MTTLTLNALARDIQAFLEFKRAMGYRYAREQFTLESLQRFARARIGSKRGAEISLEETSHAWFSRGEGRKTNTVSQDFSVVHQLCLHRRRRDPSGFVPERGWVSKTTLPFLPHIFSQQEVRQLLRAAGRLRRRNFSPVLMRTLLLVLYCTGLRFGEAVRLRLSTVDLERQVFFIPESKGRSRFVPFRNDLATEIAKWLTERERIMSTCKTPDPESLFLHCNGHALTVGNARIAVNAMVRAEELKPSRGRIGPRPYDWRHAFAVHRLTDWYRKGVDIHAKLPWLSAYMGHQNVLGTEVYLHATPELLQLASQRFAKRLHSARSIP